MEQLPECRFPFEETDVGRMKERIYNMSDAEIEDLAKEYGFPSPGELEKPGSYIQNTVRRELVENRRKNDIVIVPVGCSENHGMHTVSGFDTFLVTRISEAVRRRQKNWESRLSISHSPSIMVCTRPGTRACTVPLW